MSSILLFYYYEDITQHTYIDNFSFSSAKIIFSEQLNLWAVGSHVTSLYEQCRN